jgi:hypothetical protein
MSVQVLSRDIRSLHQRRDVAPVAVQEPAQQQQLQEHRQDQQQHTQTSRLKPNAAAEPQQMPTYTVTLDGVMITYSLHPNTGHVTVMSVTPSNSQRKTASTPLDS